MKNQIKSYFQFIQSAIRGDEHDFTAINLRKAVILLSIPMMLELALESVFAVVDIFFVNKLGIHAASVVGLTESVITIVYSVGIGLSAAATAVVARRVGEKKYDEAAKSGAQAISIALVASLALGIPGYIYAGEILGLMGAEPIAIEQNVSYARIMFGNSVVIIMLFIINGIFRGAGNPAMAMKSLWIGNLFNIALDPILIFGWFIFPEMGIKGAAVASVLGRGLGVAYQVYFLWKGSSTMQMKWHHFIPDLSVAKTIVNVAWPATFQFIIASASWIFLAAMVADYGSAASAGYQTAVRLFVFFILPAWGMSNAVATLVGQNLGAKLPDRAEESVKITTQYNVIFMALVTILFLFFSPQLVGLFVPASQPEQIRYAVLSLQIVSSGYIFYGIGMVVTQAFNGSGDTRTPTWVYFFGFWMFQIPFAYLLHKFTTIGVSGIFMSIPIAETLIAIAIYVLYRRGKWKLTEV